MEILDKEETKTDDDILYADMEKFPEHWYKKKYNIMIWDSHDISCCILKKRIGKKQFYMKVDIDVFIIERMMLTSLKMGTNYLEDCLLAKGLKWGQRAKNGIISK